jgi:3-hydroxyacyl-CoA dehydrogenase/enoyl-CoA hydratase/3-hydroxybutyryl-CoA epimerase
MTESSTTSLQISELEAGIALMTLDMPGSGANILTQNLFAELGQAMEQLAEREDLDGLILFSAKPTIFIAGADLKAIAATLDWPDEEIVKFCEHGRAVMARFSRCPFVTVAAIHGACVGGGLELPLWCDCRIASDDRRTVLGLPEVKLGLVPGWAGTARLPRIAGFEVAADLITSGRLVSATEAKQMGFVDAVVAQDDLLSAASEMIRRVKNSESYVHDRRTIMGPVTGLVELPEQLQRFSEKIVANKEVFPFAPTVVLEHLARTTPLSQQEAWKSESLAMAQVYGSPANRGLLNHFFLVDRNKKQPGLVDLSLAPQPVSSLGIVGAGLMGRSIAENCLRRGISVVLIDAVNQLAQDVAADLARADARGTITATDDYAQLAATDLVIESVVETFDVKKSVLQKIEAVVSQDMLIASNTSAIPIGKLAATLDRPRRFCGIHFCHPELMSLVEVICGPQSSEQTIATAVGFVRGLRKMPVAMNDGAGFVVNRLLGAMLDQSFRLLMQGIPVGQIDEAMRDFGFLGGPFEIIDVIGADTCMYAGRTMWEAGLQCVTLSPILPRMVKMGRLGRKTGLGFYRYPDPRGDAEWDEELPELLASYVDAAATDLPRENLKIQREKITHQILAAIALEASHIIDEELVADFRDIDLCVIHGFSFPQHQGGILFWADQVGLKTVNRTLYDIAEQEPRMEPSPMLKNMRLENETFYPL